MNDVLLIYLIAYASVALHETTHYLIATLFKIPVIEVKIGSDWPQFRYGKLIVSPIIGISYVEAEYESVLQLTLFKKTFYFLCGILMNLLFAGICFYLYLYLQRFIWLIAASINLSSVIGNSLPIGNTDMATLIKLIKKQ